MINIEANKNDATIVFAGEVPEVHTELQISVAKVLKQMSEQDGLPLIAHIGIFCEGLKLASIFINDEQPS